MPRRSARRMRQRNQIEGASFVADPERSANDFVEFFERKKLRDGKFADGNDEIGLKQIDFVVHQTRETAVCATREGSVDQRRKSAISNVRRRLTMMQVTIGK